LKDALKKAEADRDAAAKKVIEARETLKKLEADEAAAAKKATETKDALDKAEQELKKTASRRDVPRRAWEAETGLRAAAAVRGPVRLLWPAGATISLCASCLVDPRRI
jgi:hypothetical protein